MFLLSFAQVKSIRTRPNYRAKVSILKFFVVDVSPPQENKKHIKLLKHQYPFSFFVANKVYCFEKSNLHVLILMLIISEEQYLINKRFVCVEH